MSDAQNPLKALTTTPDGQVVPTFQRFMQGARQGLAPRTPKNSHEVYLHAMQGLAEESERMAEVSDAAAFMPDLDKRASISQRRAGILGKMIEVEKTKVDLLKANLDVDTVIYAVFSAVTDALVAAFDSIEAPEEEKARWRVSVLTALKDQTGGLRDKVDAKILEVREVLPKVEPKTGA